MYQFIHIETYARKASTKVKPTKPKGGKEAAAVAPAAQADGERPAARGPDSLLQKNGTVKQGRTKCNVAEVIAEALRDDGHCLHVEHPETPTFLLGDEAMLRGLPAEIERNIEAHHAKHGGRKLRADAHVLLAGVASFPRPLSEAEPGTYQLWKERTLAFLQKTYGDDLRVVLMHETDEAHPHMHFYVMSVDQVNAKQLHAGYVAAAAHPALSKASTVAYQDAMRGFQSDYYADVGHACGLLRDGPKRRRVPRGVYLAQQQEQRERVALDARAVQAHGDLLNEAAIEAQRYADMRHVVELDAILLHLERGELEAAQKELVDMREGVVRQRDHLDTEWSRIKARGQELDKREAKAKETQRDLSDQRAMLKGEGVRIKGETDLAAAVLASARQVEKATDEKAVEVEELRRDITALRDELRKKLKGFHAAQDLNALVKKPELAGMLEFIAKTPAAQQLLAVMKADPAMAKHIADSVAVVGGLSSNVPDRSWSGALSTMDAKAVGDIFGTDNGPSFGPP